jgi:hypothetical protein
VNHCYGLLQVNEMDCAGYELFIDSIMVEACRVCHDFMSYFEFSNSRGINEEGKRVVGRETKIQRNG